ncbi:MAG: fibronectin type III domain-containing protein, partial [bacterium]
MTAFSNVRYGNLQANAVALRWNKNVNLALTAQDFDGSVTTNVYTTAVSSPNFLSLSGATGSKAGEFFEGAPNNRIFWGIPPAPTGLTGTALSTSSIRWGWSNVADEEDFRVIRTSDSASLATLPINTTSWDQIGLTPDATQQVFIRAHNPLGDANSTSLTLATRSSTPTASAITAVTSATVNVSWNANSNPGYTIYEAQLSTDSTFSTATVTLSNTMTGTTTGFVALLPKTSYYFQVRSRNLDLVYSSFTTVISTRTSPETQVPVTAITVPAAGGYLTAFTTIQGAASDNLSGVTTTYVRIRRDSDIFFWTGSVWSASVADLTAVLSGPVTSRTWTYYAGAVTVVDGGVYTI